MKNAEEEPTRRFLICSRDRTGGLRIISPALSQLSYTPKLDYTTGFSLYGPRGAGFGAYISAIITISSRLQT
jgi:hypothetical protein